MVAIKTGLSEGPSVAESQRRVDTPLNVSCLLILISVLTALSMTRVLIVEDQRALLDTFTRGLREEGDAVTPAADVAEARRVLREEAVDAIVLDLMLPDGDGLSLLRELRQAGFSKPIVIVTARDAVEDRVHGLDSGADDYLVKPFSFDELPARLRAVLRRSGSAATESVLRVDDLELDVEAYPSRPLLECEPGDRLMQNGAGGHAERIWSD